MYKTVRKPQLTSECARRGLEYKKFSAPALRTCLEDDDDKKALELAAAKACDMAHPGEVNAAWGKAITANALPLRLVDSEELR